MQAITRPLAFCDGSQRRSQRLDRPVKQSKKKARVRFVAHSWLRGTILPSYADSYASLSGTRTKHQGIFLPSVDMF
jgi:hypothetical protein